MYETVKVIREDGRQEWVPLGTSEFDQLVSDGATLIDANNEEYEYKY